MELWAVFPLLGKEFGLQAAGPALSQAENELAKGLEAPRLGPSFPVTGDRWVLAGGLSTTLPLQLTCCSRSRGKGSCGAWPGPGGRICPEGVDSLPDLGMGQLAQRAPWEDLGFRSFGYESESPVSCGHTGQPPIFPGRAFSLSLRWTPVTGGGGRGRSHPGSAGSTWPWEGPSEDPVLPGMRRRLETDPRPCRTQARPLGPWWIYPTPLGAGTGRTLPSPGPAGVTRPSLHR